MKHAELEGLAVPLITDVRCLYCGHACDEERHADPERDEHQPLPTGARDPYADASTPVAVPTSSRRRPNEELVRRGMGWRRGQGW